MPRQPAWITNLHKYVRDTDIPDDEGAAMHSELQAGSDRTIVIMSGSHLEDQLKSAILTSMPHVQPEDVLYKLLFGSNGILSSFSYKITVAQALGKIDSNLSTLLNIVREMRNACAHARRPISFKTPELKHALEVLARNKKGLFQRSSPHPTLAHLDDRMLFLGVCLLLEYAINSEPVPSDRDQFVSLLRRRTKAHPVVPGSSTYRGG